MSEEGVSWGRVLMGAAVVTTAVAAVVFIPGMDGAIRGASGFVGQAIAGVGNSITNVGAWIAASVKDLADYAIKGTTQKAIALGSAAAVGAIGVAATTSFVDRVNRTTAPVTGRE